MPAVALQVQPVAAGDPPADDVTFTFDRPSFVSYSQGGCRPTTLIPTATLSASSPPCFHASWRIDSPAAHGQSSSSALARKLESRSEARIVLGSSNRARKLESSCGEAKVCHPAPKLLCVRTATAPSRNLACAARSVRQLRPPCSPEDFSASRRSTRIHTLPP